MADGYTDVDKLILERWHDVIGLMEAHEELQGRIEELIGDVGNRLEKWGDELGYALETDAKRAEFYAWKPTWMNRRKDEAAVYYVVGSFAPLGYRKIKEIHPYLWVYTENLELLKMKEADRVEFARELRRVLGDSATPWLNPDTNDADAPLGKYLTDTDDRLRVRLISAPDELFEFAAKGFKELFTLSDAIDQTLAKFRTRE
ncbi:MAG: hypothetical protein HY701_12780 [Gemmatimonadetes bacterium]|nr:hypothetical protein [Gemmatimonadota bacterium]